MTFFASERHFFQKSQLRQHLALRTNEFCHAMRFGKNTHYMTAPCDPNGNFIVALKEIEGFMDIEQLRVQSTVVHEKS